MSDEAKQVDGLKDSYLEKYGFSVPENYVFKARKGLNREIVEEISWMKSEPDWMREFRLKGLDAFEKKPMPNWGADLSGIDFADIFYFVRATEGESADWNDVPNEIKDTFDKLGIPEAERKFLAGAGAQYESEVIYHKIREDLEKMGVIFLSMDDALKHHPDLVKEYFGTIIPYTDNKFAALNSAVWSGGSFIYVPKGVKVDMPLQAYFRINTKNMGQFERTLIIVDEGAFVHYVEGCLPPGEQVSLGDRWANIESIQPGDVVMDSDGRESLVASVRSRPFKGDMLTIRPVSSANAFQVTPEHPVLAVRRRDVVTKRKARKDWLPEVNSEKLLGALPEFIPAGDLERGDFVIFPVSKITRPNSRYTAGIMRLLGYYLAEGSAYVHNKLNVPVVSFSLGAHEPDKIAELKALIRQVTGKDATEIHDESRHSVEVRVYSQELMDLCVSECGKHAAEKRLSKVVMELPAEFQAHLLETYIKGDGSLHHRKNAMVRMSTASQALAWQLQELIARQGHYATISIRKGGPDIIEGRHITRRDQYVLYYSPDKQQSEVRRGDGFFLVPIKGIERREYDGPVFNFELNSEPNAYLARGFAVHNCTAPIYSSDSLHSAVVEIVVKPGARCRYSTIQNWSNNVYNLVTKRAVAYRDATMEWVDGNLGCVLEGSTVTTPHGIKTIESLEVGDEVLSFEEKTGQLVFRKVKGKRFSGYQSVHTVSVGERKLDVTANHPFFSYVYDPDAPKKNGRYKLAYVRADHLTKAIVPRTSLEYGEPRRLAVPVRITQFNSNNQYQANLSMTREQPSHMTVGEYTTDEIMWLFGYWMGDGNIEIKYGKTEGVVRWAKVGFSTPREDRAREHLMGTMTALTKVVPVERPNGAHLAWNSKELAEFFNLNGFAGKSTDKRVPEWVWSLPETQRLAFVAGYLDADGGVTKGRFYLKSANQMLLKDVASLLVTLGITSRLYTLESEPREVVIMGVRCIAHGSYRLTIQPDQRLYKFVSSSLREKISKARSLMMHRRTIGRSTLNLSDAVEVVPVNVSEPTAETVPTWDIEVEGTGNFVSQGFIVHNSKVTMKYPAVYLMEPGAHGEVLSIAFAGKGQVLDSGGKVVHGAKNTTSKITSKSISKDGGRASYRGLLKVYSGATGVKSNVVCDALLLDEQSRSDTYPVIEIDEQDVTIGHEASVSKVGEDQLFYLMSRGLTEEAANAMVVNGFIEPLVKELPMEYAMELNRLIQLQMEGSIG